MKQHPRLKEIWVTKDGRVFRELVPSFDGAGYAQIRNGKFRQRRHVLVCETYHGNPPKGCTVVRHLNGDPADDHPKNLAWGTPKTNGQDTVRLGRSTRGTKNSQAKLNSAQALEVRTRRMAGESGKALAEEFGITQGAVCDLLKRRTWAWLR